MYIPPSPSPHTPTPTHNHFLSTAQAIPHHSRHRPHSVTNPLCDEQAEDGRRGDLSSPQQAPTFDPRVSQQQGKEIRSMYTSVSQSLISDASMEHVPCP